MRHSAKKVQSLKEENKINMGSKKGFMEMQFNWIFIIITGALILILLAEIIVNQKDASKLSADVSILKNLDAILTNLESGAGTVNVVKMPKTRIEFRCDGYSVDGNLKQRNGMSIFSPSVLEADSIVLMAMSWNVPYKAANAVYLVNPDTRYIFIGDSDFSRRIFWNMPSIVRADGYTHVGIVQDENDANIRIIFFNQNPEFPKSLYKMNNKFITALKINGNEDTGTIEFLKAEDNKFIPQGASYYIREGTLLGAIFSDNMEIYECVMENMFKKLNVVSQIYERRANTLRLMYERQECEKFYDTGSIKAIKEDSSLFSQSSISHIEVNAKNLELQNRQAQLISCPLIY